MLIHPMPNPIAFSIGPLGVHWYGLMYLLAFAQFIALGRVRIRQPHIAAAGWKKEDLDDMLFYGVLGVVLGGRLGEVLFYNPAFYFAHPADISRQQADKVKNRKRLGICPNNNASRSISASRNAPPTNDCDGHWRSGMKAAPVPGVSGQRTNVKHIT